MKITINCKSVKEDKPVKVFVSQPMGDKTNEEIAEERGRVIEILNKIGYKNVEIIDSHFNPKDISSPLECLGESLKLLSKADILYAIRGAENSRGCKIEIRCYEDYLYGTVKFYYENYNVLTKELEILEVK